jgi:hypothetical protein
MPETPEPGDPAVETASRGGGRAGGGVAGRAPRSTACRRLLPGVTPVVEFDAGRPWRQRICGAGGLQLPFPGARGLRGRSSKRERASRAARALDRPNTARESTGWLHPSRRLCASTLCGRGRPSTAEFAGVPPVARSSATFPAGPTVAD